MKKPARIGLVLLGVILVTSAYAAGAANALRFPDYGFSINPLVGHVENATHQVLTMMLPTEDGFGANVGVQLQPFTGTIEEYIKISEEQFTKLEIKTLKKKTISPTEGVFEAAGTLQGKPLHLVFARQDRQRKGVPGDRDRSGEPMARSGGNTTSLRR